MKCWQNWTRAILKWYRWQTPVLIILVSGGRASSQVIQPTLSLSVDPSVIRDHQAHMPRKQTWTRVNDRHLPFTSCCQL
ncbi:hypothetical protein EV363DRAFT_1346549 [Boletus edulis]|nr:hypothetical protein EV363DRAFT_1346549 [Boletus edulis]